jgi:hypothetical protein
MNKKVLAFVLFWQLWCSGFTFANVSAPGACDAVNNCVTFTASGLSTTGTAIAADAEFWVVGSTLYVELINRATSDVLSPADVLTGLFFTLMDTSGNLLTLTPVSATLGKSTDTAINGVTSTVVYDSQPAGGNVGGEEAYKTGINFQGASSGISSTGLGIFGQANFNGPDLASPTAVDGVQYGIVSAGDNVNTGNGGITGSGGLIDNAVQFQLTLPSNLSNFKITDSGVLSDVGFQYGTSPSEAFLCAAGCSRVPIPGTASLLLLGITSLLFLRRRRSC